MSEFSIKDIALTGFRFAREHPAAILIWAVVSLISVVLYQWIIVSMAGEATTQLMAMQEAMQTDPQSADPTAVFPLMGQMYSAMFVGLIPMLIASAILSAAATRGILQPQAGGPGFLRFGADEFRMIIVLIVVGIIIGVVGLAGSVLASILGVVVGVAASGGEPPAPGALTGPMTAIIGSIMIVVGLICLFIYGRFSLAAPLTLDRRSINIFSSVAMTKGKGGRIFRTLLLAAVLYLVVSLLGLAIFAGVAAAALGDVAAVGDFLGRPDMSSLSAFFTPLRIGYLVLMSVISALGAAIMLTPPAAIYRVLTAEGVDEVF